MAPGFSMAPAVNITCFEIMNLHEDIEYLVYNEPRRSSLGPCQGPPTGKLGFAQGALSDRRLGGPHTGDKRATLFTSLSDAPAV